MAALLHDLATPAFFNSTYIIDEKNFNPKEEMLTVSGVGEIKYEKYGQPFESAILRYLEENNILFINTSIVLKNTDGYLSPDLQAEDGYHLNTKAYKIMLKYLNDKLQSEKEKQN